jgi:hypothetical protein
MMSVFLTDQDIKLAAAELGGRLNQATQLAAEYLGGLLSRVLGARAHVHAEVDVTVDAAEKAALPKPKPASHKPLTKLPARKRKD